MEGLMTFTGFIIIVFGVLQIILFFKLWGMTNDIKDIRNKYLEENHSNTSSFTSTTPKYKGEIPGEDAKFKEDDLVVLISTGRQMRVKRVTAESKYSCYTNSGMQHEGDFDSTEIKLFK